MDYLVKLTEFNCPRDLSNTGLIKMLCKSNSRFWPKKSASVKNESFVDVCCWI